MSKELLQLRITYRMSLYEVARITEIDVLEVTKKEESKHMLS